MEINRPQLTPIVSTDDSWAGWLLEPYAHTLSPVWNIDDYFKDEVDAKLAALRPKSFFDSPVSHYSIDSMSSAASSSSSPYGPYARTGRGGAGNFVWQSELNNCNGQSGDVEAQAGNAGSLNERQRKAATLEALDTNAAIKSRTTSAGSGYIHMGRGGAGNYTQSNKIQTITPSGSSARSPSSGSVLSPSSRKTSNNVPNFSGRGGAGNYAAMQEAERRKQDEEQAVAEKKRGEIEEEVESILPAPPGAWLGGRRKSDGFDFGFT